MRHFTKESTSSGFFSDVVSAVGLGVVERQDAHVVERTFCSSGTLKYRPGFDLRLDDSPSWNLIAFLRWSTVYSDCDATSSSATTSARMRHRELHRPRLPLAVAQRLARARRVARRRRLGGDGARRGGGGAARRRAPAAARRRPAASACRAAGRAGSAPPFWSIITLLELPSTDCIVSRYRRSRVTPGAFWYSARICAEARRVALGALHDLACSRRLPDQARRHAARLRHDVVGVGLALVLLPLAVLAGLDRVVERGLHLLRRLHALQGDLLTMMPVL